MTSHTNPSPTLIGTLWPATVATSVWRALILVVAGAILLTLSARLKVPFYPVPMTMQTFIVVVVGVAYGWRLSAATLLLYLAAGAIGLPVFADTPEKGVGIPYMLGPTGGYLAGFVVAAAWLGALAQRGWDRSVPWLFALAMLGHTVIFALGVAWLARLVGFERAWAVGVAPFYLATLLKCALATAVVWAGWHFGRFCARPP